MKKSHFLPAFVLMVSLCWVFAGPVTPSPITPNSVNPPVPEIFSDTHGQKLSVTTEQSVAISISLDAQDRQDMTGDWWLIYVDPENTIFSLTNAMQWQNTLAPVLSIPLISFQEIPVFADTLPTPGTYTFYFAVDGSADGQLEDPIWFDALTVTVSAVGPDIPGEDTGRLMPGSLVYQGAFLFPENDAWAYSGHALAYYAPGNSLYTATHAQDGYVGEISIPEPVKSASLNDLPRAEIRQAPADITGSWKDNCTFDPGCIYRELDGLAFLPNINKMAWNLRDWYNAGKYDQDSLGWSNPDMTDARGVWHVGERGSDNDLFHNARTSNYLFAAPKKFAAQWLNNKWLIAGGTREAGAVGGSQGPTLFALAPWEDGSPPAPGSTLDALPLLYYPENIDCIWENTDLCSYPGYRAVDQWNGGAWMETSAGSAIVITGKKGLGPNCYGEPEECGNDPCVHSKGYHAYPYQGQILFYDPEDITAVRSGTRSPWQVLPYQVMSLEDISYMGDCTVMGAAAWDAANQRLFITEKEINDTDNGLWGITVVHVWQVQ